MSRRFLLAPTLSLWATCTLLIQSAAVSVRNVQVHNVPLRRSDENSPYCYCVSSATDLMAESAAPAVNFLATQVWPSARQASSTLERHLEKSWSVCEFGCGPGLPSLTAAKLGARAVVATDLDFFALDMVQAAAQAQQLANLETARVDLTSPNDPIPTADLYVLSDVFESSSVACGAAAVTAKLLASGSRVWVFAQTDRSQREIFLNELRSLHDSDLSWQSVDKYDPSASLWLCDVDESKVSYG